MAVTKRVTVIPGDGVGPEVVESAVRVLKATGADLAFEWHPAGWQCKRDHGEYLPASTLVAAKRADAVLFGAITSPLRSEDPDYRSVILQLREALDLFVNVRPVRDVGQPCLVPGIDLVIFRENSEGEYNRPEEEDEEGVTLLRRVTRRGCTRLTDFAFDWCERHGRRSLTAVHKANVIRKSDGLFLDVFRSASARSAVAAREMLVDNCAFQLVRDARQFDAIVTLNLYGDILSDEGAGLAGGLGFAASGSFGPDAALFEPVHGSAPDIAGKGVVNPAATILSAGMLLAHLGFAEEAARVEDAVRVALGKGRTRDAGGVLGTEAFTHLVVKAVESV